MKSSEFGTGFIYPLALYAMHIPRIEHAKTIIDFSIGIAGASDHLQDIIIPDDLPKKIVKDIQYLKNRLYRNRYIFQDFNAKIPKARLRIVSQSKKLFFDIDKYYLKIDPIRSEVE